MRETGLSVEAKRLREGLKPAKRQNASVSVTDGKGNDMTDKKPFTGGKPVNGVPDIGPFREAPADAPTADVRRAFRLFGLDEPDYDRCADVSRFFRQGTEAGSKVPDWELLADGVDDWWRKVTSARQAAYLNRDEFAAAVDAFIREAAASYARLREAYERFRTGR